MPAEPHQPGDPYTTGGRRVRRNPPKPRRAAPRTRAVMPGMPGYGTGPDVRARATPGSTSARVVVDRKTGRVTQPKYKSKPKPSAAQAWFESSTAAAAPSRGRAALEAQGIAHLGAMGLAGNPASGPLGFLRNAGGDLMDMITGVPAGAQILGENVAGFAPFSPVPYGRIAHLAGLPGTGWAEHYGQRVQNIDTLAAGAVADYYKGQYGPLLRGDLPGFWGKVQEHPLNTVLDIAGAKAAIARAPVGLARATRAVVPKESVTAGRITRALSGDTAAERLDFNVRNPLRGFQPGPGGLHRPPRVLRSRPTTIEEGRTAIPETTQVVPRRAYSRDVINRAAQRGADRLRAGPGAKLEARAEAAQLPPGARATRTARRKAAVARPFTAQAKYQRYQRGQALTTRDVRTASAESVFANNSAPAIRAMNRLKPAKHPTTGLPTKGLSVEQAAARLHLDDVLPDAGKLRGGKAAPEIRDLWVRRVEGGQRAERARGQRTDLAREQLAVVKAIPDELLYLTGDSPAVKRVRAAVDEGRKLDVESQRMSVEAGVVTRATAEESRSRASGLTVGGQVRWEQAAGKVAREFGRKITVVNRRIARAKVAGDTAAVKRLTTEKERLVKARRGRVSYIKEQATRKSPELHQQRAKTAAARADLERERRKVTSAKGVRRAFGHGRRAGRAEVKFEVAPKPRPRRREKGEPSPPGLEGLGDRVVYREHHRAEASNERGKIVVGPKFLKLSERQQRSVIAHELGHDLDEALLKDPKSWVWDAKNWEDAKGTPMNGPKATPGERIADAYGVALTGAVKDARRWPAILRIAREARKRGLPIHPDITRMIGKAPERIVEPGHGITARQGAAAQREMAARAQQYALRKPLEGGSAKRIEAARGALDRHAKRLAKMEAEARGFLPPRRPELVGKRGVYTRDVALDPRTGGYTGERRGGKYSGPAKAQRSKGVYKQAALQDLNPNLLIEQARRATENWTGRYSPQALKELIGTAAYRDASGKFLTGAKASLERKLDPSKVAYVHQGKFVDALKELDGLPEGEWMPREKVSQFLSDHIPEGARKSDYIVISKDAGDVWTEAMTSGNSLVRHADTLLNWWKGGLLALSPRWYVNNTVGLALQYVLLTGGDFRAVFQANRMSRPIRGAMAKRHPEIVKDTLADELVGKASLPKLMRAGFRINSKLEEFWRRGAYLSRAKKGLRERGLRPRDMSDAEVARAIETMPEPMARQIVRDIDFFIGNYRKFNKYERTYFKRVLPFYSWLRVIARLTFVLPFRSPTRALALATLAKAQEAGLNPTDKALDYFERGPLDTPVGKVATWSLNPWQSLAGVVAALGDDNPAGRLLQEALGWMHPGLQAGAQLAFGKNPFGQGIISPPGTVPFGRAGALKWNPITKHYERQEVRLSFWEAAIQTLAPGQISIIKSTAQAVAGNKVAYGDTSTAQLLGDLYDRWTGGKGNDKLYLPEKGKRARTPAPLNVWTRPFGLPLYKQDDAAVVREAKQKIKDAEKERKTLERSARRG